MEERVEQSNEVRVKTSKKAAPVFFDSFFHVQEKAMGRTSVLFPPHPKDDPYSYRINISKNPYQEPCIGPLPPPPPPFKTWKKRGVVKSIRQSQEEKNSTPRAIKRWDHRGDGAIHVPEGRKSFSETLAPKTYQSSPFGYEFLKHPLWKL
jgi:hypothetical protein